MKRLSISILTLLSLTSGVFAQDDGCDSILTSASRNYSIETYDLAIASSFHKNYCTGKQAKSNLTIGADLDSVYQELPAKFKFNLGNSKDNINKSCEQIYDDFRRQESSYRYASTVVAESTDAWLACKQLAREGIAFRPVYSKTQVVIDVRKLGAGAAEVQGVTVTPAEALSCTVPNDNISSGTTEANPHTRKTLTDQNWAITCIRNGTPDKTGWVYGSADVSIKTSASRSLLLPIPSDAKPNFDWASSIQSRTDELQALQDQLRADNSRLELRSQALEETIKQMKSNFKISMHRFYTGEYNQPGDHGDRWDDRNGPAESYAKQVCGNATPFLTKYREHAGNCCGYGYYNLVCISFE